MTRGGGKRAAIGAVLIAVALGFGGTLANIQPDAARATDAPNASEAPAGAQSGAGSGEAQNRAAPPPTQPNPSSAAAAAAQSTTDYDDDDDGLIDIRTLAQLNAIRHDLNGNGDATHATYVAAFPSRDTAASSRMGCPSGTCTGYELRADLNFDTDGDGDVDSSDSPSYTDWVPIGGTYSGTFKGNNRTISNLTMTGSATEQNLGLFALASGEITGVGLLNVAITSTYSTASLATGTGGRVGALVGRTSSVVRSSYATGSITHTSAARTYMWIGGLVGQCTTGSGCDLDAIWADVDISSDSGSAAVGGLVGWLGASLTTCYATGSVTVTSSSGRASSLVGNASASGASINACYATGAMSGIGVSTHLHAIIGFTDNVVNVPTATTYWDSDTTNRGDTTATRAQGKTTSQLQTPTGYTGIYSTWNLNIDGVSGNDDPWDFGSSSEYPVLKFGEMDTILQRGDYDDDDDGLIDIRNLAQLNAIRHDLNGNGDATHAAYVAAFPHRDTAAATRMGCPETSMPADTTADCIGYELMNDLDFDTDGDGDVDSSDSPSFANWTPIGGTYSAEFKGNNKTIANLRITGAQQHYVGLFRQASGAITGVGLPKVVITSTRQVGSLDSASTGGRVGALVGRTTNAVRASYATGSITHTGGLTTYMLMGGLVGECASSSNCVVAASWADVDVISSATVAYTGGLVGWLGGSIIASYAKGAVNPTASGAYGSALAGSASTSASITASYATGAMNGRAGSVNATDGVLGFTTNRSSIPTNSYWDTGTTDRAHNANTNAEGKTTSQLQTVTSYTGIYANWNVNVDGVAGVDDPWDFGTGMQYPMLKWGGMSLAAQGGLVMGIPGTNNNNPVVGQTAQVCLVDGPTGRAAGTGGAPYQPWQWQKSSDGISWTDITEDGGATYEYTPVTTSPTDVGNYLRACVDTVATLGVDRLLGEDRVCVGPFAKVRASN